MKKYNILTLFIIILLAACQTDEPAMPNAQEQEITLIIPTPPHFSPTSPLQGGDARRAEGAGEVAEGRRGLGDAHSLTEGSASTRLTDPDADGRQQWTDGDKLYLTILIYRSAGASDINFSLTATYNGSKGEWTFSAPITVPADATNIYIYASYIRTHSPNEFYYDDEFLVSTTVIILSITPLTTAPIPLNNFDHWAARIRFTGFTPGHKLWFNYTDKWNKSRITASHNPTYAVFAANDHLAIGTDGTATLYTVLTTLTAAAPQYTVTDASTTTRPDITTGTWHTFDLGEPNAGRNYFNRTYEIINPNPLPGTGSGTDDEDQWLSLYQQLNAAGYNYIIKEYADLTALATIVNNGGSFTSPITGQTIAAANIKAMQLADITMPGGETWTPIGTATNPFTGTYNGGGHTITALATAATYNKDAGLFGYIEGVAAATPALIANVHLTNCNITSTTGNAGALAAYTGNHTLIATCTATGTVTGSNYTGGLVGEANTGTVITRSSSHCTVTGGGYNTGGLVGQVGVSSTIAVCYTTGRVTGLTYTGALVGQNSGTIRLCYAEGNVHSTHIYGYSGAFAGYNLSAISHSYATGTATATTPDAVGTFAGTNTGNGSFDSCHARPGQTVGTGTTTGITTAGTAVATVRQDDAEFACNTIRTTGYRLDAAASYPFRATEAWNTEDTPTLNFDLNNN